MKAHVIAHILYMYFEHVEEEQSFSSSTTFLPLNNLSILCQVIRTCIFIVGTPLPPKISGTADHDSVHF